MAVVIFLFFYLSIFLLKKIMELKNFLQSNRTKHILYGIGTAVVALLIFQAGVIVGFKKASFSNRLGDNFYRTFGERRDPRGLPPSFGMMQGVDPSNAHGTIGKIAGIALPQLIVADRDGTEKTIVVSDKTDIRRFRDSIKPTELKVGDIVTIIGAPTENGQIKAELIRVMPVSEEAAFQTFRTGVQPRSGSNTASTSPKN